ncbi:TolC family outer membrane protein [Chitinilyticum piscinae]|uniref:TolC family outer membrane protein n=1 Tax=Chitinilyticum piscinae TaxID=2866724 RepID=A0A8J7KBS9_9NEIS|nr:TolC family outer membrane protein [Chitinilyticum piscinae]MBE9610549.1 TolC family outer membrane protein [Chitinilyticum piscinae]
MKVKKTIQALLLIVGLSAQPISAGELQALYSKALQNDPQYSTAVSVREAAQEFMPMARAGFFPRIGIGASYGRNDTERDAPIILNIRKKIDYEFYPENYSLTLTQPLLRPAIVAEYNQARWRTEQAEADFGQRTDELKQRLAEAYLRTLVSSARMKLIDQQKVTFEALLRQAERSYASGYGTVTEVAESQSRLDELLSEQVTAKALNENQLAVLRQIIGMPNYTIAAVDFKDFAPTLHGELSLAEWKEVARLNSPELRAESARVKGAGSNVEKALAAFSPTLDLRLQYSKDKDSGYSNEGVILTSRSAVLSFNFPVFEGGYTVSQYRQSTSQLTAAQENLRAVTEGLDVDIEKEYGNVVSLVVRIQALQRSVQTNELLVKATAKSVDAGVRSNVDLLNAQSRLFEAKLKLSESRISYLLSLVRLKIFAGVFADSDFAVLDGALF